MILRDRDTTGASPDTLDERVYFCQNWRADVVSLLSSAGEQLEQVRYSAYGVPFLLPAGDVKEPFGVVDTGDTNQFVAWINASAYDVRGDLDLDGDVDADDIALIKTGAAGRGVLSHADHGNRLGYAGYVHDPHLAGSKWHVRHRVLDSELGGWLRRDPLSYTDSFSLYAYVTQRPILMSDPLGLFSASPNGGTAFGDTCIIDPLCTHQCCSYAFGCLQSGINTTCSGGGNGGGDPDVFPAWNPDDGPGTREAVHCSQACGQFPGSLFLVQCVDGRRVICECHPGTPSSHGGEDYDRDRRQCRIVHELHNWTIRECPEGHTGNPVLHPGLPGWTTSCNEFEALVREWNCISDIRCGLSVNCFWQKCADLAATIHLIRQWASACAQQQEVPSEDVTRWHLDAGTFAVLECGNPP